MKKVKITVLKTTLDEELAREYGADGLGPCISMFLPWPMGRERAYFTMGTGLDGLVWPSAAATMGCGL